LFNSKLLQAEIKSKEAIIQSLIEQNKTLLDCIKELTRKTEQKPSAIQKPQVFDHELQKYRAKTDAEIEQDLQGLRELGITA
jgi:hypothetical protein